MLLKVTDVPLENILTKKKIDLSSNLNLIVDKRGHKLLVYSDTTFIKSYKIAYGRSQNNIKRSLDDYVTPIGEYSICSIDVSENYYRLFKINFPNIHDAAEAYKNGDISKNEYDKIINSYDTSKCPTSDTKLGANVGIHGIGVYNFIFKNLPFSFNWTNGSISISNENIDEIFPYIKLGTKVTITN